MGNFGIRSRLSLIILFYLVTVVSAGAQAVSPELYSGLKWRLIGPFRGGRVVAVTGVAGDPARFYFGSVNGGIWQTTDAGVVWQPIFDHQSIASIGAIAVAPSDPKTIYAGTGESDIRSDLSSGDGVYKSVDGGQTWANIGLRDSRQISRIVVDPKDAGVVYVAALGHAYRSNAERGVFKTTDGGAHWTKVLDRGPDVGAASLAIATGNPNILFATMWQARRPPWSTYAPLGGPGSGLYRSLDAGQTWSHLTGAGLPDGDWQRSGVTVSTSGKRIYVLVDAKKRGLYRSDDGGDTWSLENSDPRLTSRSWYFSDITIDPKNPDVVYMPNVALYRSEDGGKTITIVRGAPGGDDYHQLWVDPNDSNRMILGSDQGTTISIDYGKTWSSWYNQPTAQIYHVITDDKFPYNVYGTQQDSGGIALPSRTDHGQITGQDWFSPDESESGYIAPDPRDPNILYASGAYGSVARFDLKTSFSQDVTPWPVPIFGTEITARKYRDPWNPVLLFSPFDKKTLYLGTQFVMKTTDGGLHWEQISPDLTGATKEAEGKKPDGPATAENARQRGYGTISTISASSLNGDLIWAGSDTGLVHLTRDGGKTWANVTPKGLTDWSKISFIEASHFDHAEAYVAVDRHRLDDQQPYLYRTRDYGATWQSITDGIPARSFVWVVRQDLVRQNPQNKSLLFAGTDLGIYVSFDDGDHWQSLQLNLPTTSVQDLVIHGDDLVVATHGRSFWILDDITLLRQLSHPVESGLRLFSPATVVRVDNDAFLGTPLPPEEPTAENPPNGAIVDYYLKKAADQVKLEIFDAKGELVRSFSLDEKSNGKSSQKTDEKENRHPSVAIAERWFPAPQLLDRTAGMHRFVWDLTWSRGGEKPDEQAGEDESRAPHGPRVVPGTYQVRLTVDGQASTQPLKIAMDPRSAATPAELEQQYRLGLKMFAEVERGRQTLAEIRAFQARLADREEKLSGQTSGAGPSGAKMRASQDLDQIKGYQDQMKKILSGDGLRSGDGMGLEVASAEMASALHAVESGDRTVPAQVVAVFEESARAAKLRIEEWSGVKATVSLELR